MIDETEFITVQKEAFAFAQAFINGYLEADNFHGLQEAFHSLSEAGAASSSFVTLLTTFVFDVTGCPTINSRLPQQGFASWLINSGTSSSITFDTHQMQVWHQESGMPIKVQRVRSLIHELGHILLSPYLLAGPGRRATPEDEEKAWIFTKGFFGILLGHYSLICRGTVPTRDECPKIFL